MSFFDTTPLGRIINRFSKDVDTMDNRNSDSYRMFLQTFGTIVATLALIIVVFYWFILALLPLALLFLYAASFYRATGIFHTCFSNRSP
jgi:ATP-binding cassette, subfamily C (CFTR/MRP), member 1